MANEIRVRAIQLHVFDKHTHFGSNWWLCVLSLIFTDSFHSSASTKLNMEIFLGN